MVSEFGLGSVNENENAKIHGWHFGLETVVGLRTATIEGSASDDDLDVSFPSLSHGCGAVYTWRAVEVYGMLSCAVCCCRDVLSQRELEVNIGTRVVVHV